MPNWCYNNLKVEAEATWTKDEKKHSKDQELQEKELKKFIEENFNGNTLTFDGTVPMPKSLNITSGSNVDQAISYLNAKQGKYTELDKTMDYQWTAKECKFKEKDSMAVKRKKTLKYLESVVTQQSLKEGQMALDNIKKYGCKDWYNWRISNWGTKWDASEGGLHQSLPHELEASFDTAWAPPIEWLYKVTKKYKKLKFTLEYTEEGMGFEGKAYARNGDVVDNNMNIDYPDTFWD